MKSNSMQQMYKKRAAKAIALARVNTDKNALFIGVSVILLVVVLVLEAVRLSL